MILVGFFCVLGAIGLLVAGLAQADPDLVWASITASAVGGLAVAIAAVQRGKALRRAEQADDAGGKVPIGGRRTSAQPSPPRATAAEGTAVAVPTADPTTTDGPAVGAPELAAPELAAPELAAPDLDARAIDAPDLDAPEQDDVSPSPAGGPTADADASTTATPTPATTTDATTTAPADAAPVADPVDADPEGGEDKAADPVDEPGEEDVDMADLLMIIDLSDEVLVVDLRPRYHIAVCGHLDNREAIPLPVNEAREDGFTPCGLCRPDATLAGRTRQLRPSTS